MNADFCLIYVRMGTVRIRLEVINVFVLMGTDWMVTHVWVGALRVLI